MIDDFGFGLLAGLAVMLFHPFVDYFMHRKDKLCYHCGQPYKDAGDGA